MTREMWKDDEERRRTELARAEAKMTKETNGFDDKDVMYLQRFSSEPMQNIAIRLAKLIDACEAARAFVIETPCPDHVTPRANALKDQLHTALARRRA